MSLSPHFLRAIVAGLAVAAAGVAAAQSFDYRYTKTQPAEESSWPPKAECVDPFTEATIPHGQSVTAWMAASVAWNAACQSEQRVCNDGVLGGSFTSASCAVETPLACSLPWGGSLDHGAAATAYQYASVPFEAECPSEQRSCVNGELSGVWTVQACTNLAQDLTPTAFTVGAQTNLPPGGQAQPAPIQITSITGNVPVALANYNNEAVIRVCADAACASIVQDWTAGPLTIRNNQWLAIRSKVATTLSTTISNTVTVGTYSTAFNSTTSATYCGGVGGVCQDGTLYAGISGGKPLFVPRCDAGQFFNGNGCAGTRNGTMKWGDKVQVGTLCPGVDCGNGQSRSAAIAALGTQYQLATYCESLTEGGHSDWYLPSRSEISHIYSVRTTGMLAGTFDAVNSFPYYASSSEYSVDYYWIAIFNNGGGTGIHTKDSQAIPMWLRCVRTPV